MLFWIILLVTLSVGLGYAILASNNGWEPKKTKVISSGCTN